MSQVTCPDCGLTMREARRYPMVAVAEFLSESMDTAMRHVGVSGTMQKQYRCHGVTRQVADRIAAKAGVHPSTIWPDIVRHDIEDFTVVCADEKCGERFWPSRKGHRFCSSACSRRQRARSQYRARYQSDPEFAARERERVREYRQQSAKAAAAYARRWKTKNAEEYRRQQARYRAGRKEHIARNRRERYLRERETILAKQRDYDARRREARKRARSE